MADPPPLDKVIFPDLGIPRREIFDYYQAAAPWMLPHLQGRNLTVWRCPQGIDGPSFFQKHPRRPHEEKGTTIVVDSVTDLLDWIGLGVIEWHVPLGHRGHPRLHDWAVFDLDPNPPAGWQDVGRVAKILLGLLDGLSFPYGIKTSGNRGLHVYIPIEPTAEDVVVGAIRTLSQMVAAVCPQWSTTERRVDRRGARVYLDYLQNGHTRTMAGVLTLRANRTAGVSTPIVAEEIKIPAEMWSLRTVRGEIDERGRLFRNLGAPVNLAQVLQQQGIAWMTGDEASRWTR